MTCSSLLPSSSSHALTLSFSFKDLGYNGTLHPRLSAPDSLTTSLAALPFLIRSELLLFPIVIFFALYVVSLLGWNIAKVVLETMFGV